MSGVTSSGGGKMPIFRKYTTSQVWTKPAGLAGVRVWAGGGSGGGGGVAVANGGFGQKGQSGNTGSMGYKIILAENLNATEILTIGSGGGGGLGAQNGFAGGNTSFGGHIVASGGRGGYHGSHANRSAAVIADQALLGDLNIGSVYVGSALSYSTIGTLNQAEKSLIDHFWFEVLGFQQPRAAIGAADGIPPAAATVTMQAGAGGQKVNGASPAIVGGSGFAGFMSLEEFY